MSVMRKPCTFLLYEILRRPTTRVGKAINGARFHLRAAFAHLSSIENNQREHLDFALGMHRGHNQRQQSPNCCFLQVTGEWLVLPIGT